MKLRALLLLTVFVLTACAPEANHVSNLGKVARYTPLVAYAVPVEQETVDGRTWQTISIFTQKMGQEPEQLIDRIGGVGEYPGGFAFSPDNQELLVNLENKLVGIDLETKEVRDIFIPNKQVLSYIFKEDDQSIIVWDQEYGPEDFEYFIYEVNVETGEMKQLYQADADGKYFFIHTLNPNGDLLLFQSAGEAAAPWVFDFEANELKPVPGLEEPQPFIGFSENGSYVVYPDQMLDDVCNTFFGSAPSVYAYADVNTGEVIGKIGNPEMHTQIIAMSPDDTEVLYAEFSPIPEPEQCEEVSVPDAFYRAAITGEETVEIDDQEQVRLFAEWVPRRAGLDFDTLPDGSSTLLYYGELVKQFLPQEHMVATTVIE